MGLDILYEIVWGYPLLILISAAGIYLTIILKGIQFRYLWYGIKVAVGGGNQPGEGKGDISHFQSLMTALAATIGIGNIAGVSTAVVIGGYGAIFWMWITALLGMATKYGEAYLAVKFRHVDKNGEMAGGPMFFIEKGLSWRWLAVCFALFGTIASFGGGNMLQANSIADALSEMLSVPPYLTGIAVAVFVGLTLIGGIKSIGRVASVLVPFMALFYLIGAFIVLGYHLDRIPYALWRIFQHAFTGEAAFGGFAGATVMMGLQVGVSRGLMTSEAGLGTASIAAAAAKTDVPGRQAMVSMTGSFISTIVMCTITGLVLGVTEVFGIEGVNGKLLTGVALTMAAFESVFSWGEAIVTVAVVFFGFTTLLGWAYYGEKCIEYLLGEGSIPYFRFVFTLIIFPGAVLDLELVWKISDIFNGMMAFPNLIGIIALSGIITKETQNFLTMVKNEQLK
jgi:alanine or glycine:cation symporter, AGCS family